MRFTWMLLGLAALLTLGCGGGGGGPVVEAVAPEQIVDCEHEDFTPGPGDRDGDTRLDEEELAGYEIQVDFLGLGTDAGHLAVYRVVSDPGCPDTDHDGLSDRVEYLLRTDPSNPDTDGDGLGDRDEVLRWKTSPVSVDSDGDATGRYGTAAPNALLFDGAELEFGTSPSLADTDGDAKTDFEEFDDPTRDPRLAELPSASLEFEGEVDVRLRVTYEESSTTETEYGETLTTKNETRTIQNQTDSSVLESESSAALFQNAGSLAKNFLPKGGGKGLRAAPQKMSGASESEIAIATAVAVVGGVVVAAAVADQLYCATAGKRDAEGPVHFRQDDPAAADGSAAQTAREFNDTASSWLCYPKTTDSEVVELTTESVESAEQSYSTYRRESRTRTETTSSGSVKVGATIRNTGPTTVAIDDVFVTMMQWQPSVDPGASVSAGKFRTLATLVPVIDTVVLAPGEASPVLEMTADDVDPGIIKEFLARPGSIVYGPPGVSMTDSQGLDFKYLTENTLTRTARITIDYGDGRVERHHVATNVDRTEDGELAGTTMGAILEILDLDYETVAADLEDEETGEALGTVNVLTRIGNVAATEVGDVGDPANGVARDVVGAWMVVTSREGDWTPDIDFQDLVVQFGDDFHLIYCLDRDGDGLFTREEALLGTTDDADPIEVAGGFQPRGFDTDLDGLSDFVEARVGWEVTVDYGSLPGETSVSYRCNPNPRSADADGDGWNDARERVEGTDPNNEDTDDDTIADALDPYPLVPARRLHVDADAVGPVHDGTTWDYAYVTLGAALDRARELNTDADDHNDISSIWVADGTYTVGDWNAPFALLDHVGIFGGFRGGERTQSERDPNPATNGTRLSGDLNGNDPADFGDNSVSVIWAEDVGPSCVLDGFSVAGGSARPFGGSPAGYGGGIRIVDASPTLRNLLVIGNRASDAGAGVYQEGTGEPLLEDCVVVDNVIEAWASSTGAGGGLSMARGDLRRCTVRTNAAAFGGGLQVRDGALLRVADCLFERNVAYQSGGAVQVQPNLLGNHVRLERCRFFRNRSNGSLAFDGGGALHLNYFPFDGWRCEVIGCVFDENEAQVDGSAVWAFSGGGLHMVNCTVVRNTILTVLAVNGSALALTHVVPPQDYADPSVYNSILYGNRAPIAAGQDPQATGWIETQIFGHTATEPTRGTHYCCIEGAGLVHGLTNLGADPGLGPQGLRPQAGSPCIDTGLSTADLDPNTPGLQQLGGVDLDGKPRIADGTGDGQVLVDIGAFER